MRFVIAHIAEFGHPPTLREIAAGIGCREVSVNYAHQLVQTLVRRGYLSRRDGRARGLKVLRQPSEQVSGKGE